MIQYLNYFTCSFCMWFRYVLGAVETFLKAIPAAGIFRGNNELLVPFDSKFPARLFKPYIIIVRKLTVQIYD